MRSDYYNRTRHDVLALLPRGFSPQSVLDVGCGEGNTAVYLKEKFAAEVFGVEINESVASLARNKVDHLFSASIEEALPNLPKDHFDLILCLDILEHLVDPWTVLKQLVSCLKAEGYMLISLPNVQNWRILADLILGRWNYADSGLMDRTHLRFFTKHSAQQMISEASLRVVGYRGSMGPEIRLLDLLTLAVFRSYLTYHLYFLAAKTT